MSLAATQRRMQQAVLLAHPSTLPDVAARDRDDADERVGIYRHGYRARLVDGLRTEFPGLVLLAGTDGERLLRAYVAAHPSSHYNIRWHGAGLAAFLDEARPWRDRPALAAMARLDWAVSTAFDTADEPALAGGALAGLAPEAWPTLRLVPMAGLQVLTVRHNLIAFRRAADDGGARPRLVVFRHPRRVLVWRQALDVRYRQLPEDEYVVLDAARRGASFATLCDILGIRHGEAAAMPRMVELLQGWLAADLLAGWHVGEPRDAR